MGVYLIKEESNKRKKGEGEYMMAVTTAAELRMQNMATYKAYTGQLDFGDNNPLWSAAFRLVEKAQKWRVRVRESNVTNFSSLLTVAVRGNDVVQEGHDVVRWPAGSPEEAHQLIYLPQIPKKILAWKHVVAIMEDTLLVDVEPVDVEPVDVEPVDVEPVDVHV
ncbi:LOW QUALITY PROTEIN: hypothetical protein DAPPUDRAFT_268362 [Daphnia pulex]|uniref:Uncharacterized protein n=1 Tax=Daphnia pulex TaxID=6669 RepID=E9HXQ1_DAPPU|nr:LOW QUALITY PROTEIN: hypothetical protein DAPPUDRAFT_268362 [Daphnia pulex]|eukprot:EFX63479.1 LOW QUALITY PROTEIN: hypothetical protein DAPPUDRAFT_268362 [Daphnia pulex]